jgi:hypothetical protein
VGAVEFVCAFFDVQGIHELTNQLQLAWRFVFTEGTPARLEMLISITLLKGHIFSD